MRISKIRGCSDAYDELIGVTLILNDIQTNEILELETLGTEVSISQGRRCTELELRSDDSI